MQSKHILQLLLHCKSDQQVGRTSGINDLHDEDMGAASVEVEEREVWEAWEGLVALAEAGAVSVSGDSASFHPGQARRRGFEAVVRAKVVRSTGGGSSPPGQHR